MKTPVKLLPRTVYLLKKFGNDIYDARRRHRLTQAILAKRANLSPITVAKIEKGDPTVSMGGYASVLIVLGILDRMTDAVDARHDLTGRMLMDEMLPKRVRYSKNKSCLEKLQ